MNLRDEILLEHSKPQALRIAHWIGRHPGRYAQLARIFLEGDSKIAQRAAWIISHCADKYPDLALPHLSDFINYAKNPPHVAVKRNVLRVASMTKIPEDLEGKLYDLSYHFVRQSKEDIAVRAHAMTIITTIALKYPELKPEVVDVLISLKHHDSAGLRSRSRNMLKKLGVGK